VYFLFAKKLKDKAQDVEIKLLRSGDKPYENNKNKIEKSIKVLVAPTNPKRNLSA